MVAKIAWFIAVKPLHGSQEWHYPEDLALRPLIEKAGFLLLSSHDGASVRRRWQHKGKGSFGPMSCGAASGLLAGHA